MLYDPKWEKTETKADPLSLTSLIAWLEKQPTAKAYCYQDNGACLLGQYFTAHGLVDVNVGGLTFNHGRYPNRPSIPLPETFRAVARGNPRTFGAALERARNAARC